MVLHKTKSSSTATHDDLIQTAKALRDGLRERVESTFDERCKSLESEVTLRMARVFDKELGSRVKSVQGDYETKLSVMQEEFRDLLALQAGKHEKQISDLRREMHSWHKTFETGLATIKELLRSLPIPQVNVSVPENAIEFKHTVEQLPSQVSIALPDSAILVQVQQSTPVCNVSIPENAIEFKHTLEQQPTVVNVSIPENAIQIQQSTPVCNVNLPENAILVNIPQTNVTIPADSIRIEVNQPNVVIPTDAIRVDVNQPTINFTVPEKAIEIKQLPSSVVIPNEAIRVDVNQIAPVFPKEAIKIDVTQATPNIDIHVPSPRLVKKVFSYDDMGRPDMVVEKEIEENGEEKK